VEAETVDDPALAKLGAISQLRTSTWLSIKAPATWWKLDAPTGSATGVDSDLNLNGQAAHNFILGDMLDLMETFFEDEGSVTINGEAVANDDTDGLNSQAKILEAIGVLGSISHAEHPPSVSKGAKSQMSTEPHRPNCSSASKISLKVDTNTQR
jgi:hypothetical protein